MAKKMTFYYDKEGDLLDISIGKPQKAVSTEIADDFFVRKDKSGKIVGFSILNFEEWFKGSKKEERVIPLTADFHFALK